MAGVEHVSGVCDDQVVVDVIVVGQDDDGGCPASSSRSARPARLPAQAGHVGLSDVVVDVAEVGAEGDQPLHDAEGRRLAQVGGVGLVRQAEEQDPAPLTASLRRFRAELSRRTTYRACAR